MTEPTEVLGCERRRGALRTVGRDRTCARSTKVSDGTTRPDSRDGEDDGGSESPHALKTQQAWLQAEISMREDDGEDDIKNSSNGYRRFYL